MEEHRIMLLGCQSGKETVHVILSLEKSVQLKVIVLPEEMHLPTWMLLHLGVQVIGKTNSNGIRFGN